MCVCVCVYVCVIMMFCCVCVDMILMHIDSMAGLREELKRLPISKVTYQPTLYSFAINFSSIVILSESC